MASKKKNDPGVSRTREARAARKAEKATQEASKTKEQRKEEQTKAREAFETRVAQGARLNDFLTDYGIDEAGRPITDPNHSLRTAISEDPTVGENILEQYQIHQLPFEVKEELGLNFADPMESLGGAPRGGLAAGEVPNRLSDVTSIEDDENIGADTGVLSSQLTAGGSRSIVGKATIGDLTPSQPGPRQTPAMGGPLSSPGPRRRFSLPRMEQIRQARKEGRFLDLSPDPTIPRVAGSARSDVTESTRLPDVPKDTRWTDLGLAPTTKSVRGVRDENRFRRIAGESAVRMHLEQQTNPSGQIVIPRSFNVQDVNPAFRATADYLAEVEGDPSEWSPETKRFFREHGMSGIAAGSTVGGSTVAGADAVPRKVGTTRLGRVRGNNPYLITTGNSQRFPKGSIVNIDYDKLSGQFQRSDIDIATGETVRQPELDIAAVPGTVPAGGDLRQADLTLANPLSTVPLHPSDPNYKPRYAAVDIPIVGENDTDDAEQQRQDELARKKQTAMLAGGPDKKGAQPFQTGIKPSGSGKFTRPDFGMREKGSGWGVFGTPHGTGVGPDIEEHAKNMAAAAGVTDWEKLTDQERTKWHEEALGSYRELGGVVSGTESMLNPESVGSSVYDTHDFLRARPTAKPRYATERRIKIPKANKALKKNPVTGEMERDTQSYQVFTPTMEDLDTYLNDIDDARIKEGKPTLTVEEVNQILELADTSTGSFRKRKMTRAEKAAPLGDTSMGGRRPAKLLKSIYKRPSSGQFSEKTEAEMRVAGARRSAEADVITGRFNELRTGANKEYDTAGYIQSWDKLESVIGRQIMPSKPIDAQDFSSRLLGTDIEQFEADQTGKAVTSATDSGAYKLPGETYNRPKFFRYSKNATPSMPDTLPGGKYTTYDERMATPFAAFSTMAPERDAKPVIEESAQLGDIYSAATGHRLGTEPRPTGTRGQTTVSRKAKNFVPSVMDREAFAAYQQQKAAEASAPAEATPKRGKKATAEQPAPPKLTTNQTVVKSKRNNK